MSITIFETECDFCLRGLSLNEAYNIDYKDGFSNVLCVECVDETMVENIAEVFPSV